MAYEHFNARHADESDPIRQANHRAANDARERAQDPLLVSSPARSLRNPGAGWIRRFARPIKSSSQEASALSSSTSRPCRRSTRSASLRQPGSAFGEPHRKATLSFSC